MNISTEASLFLEREMVPALRTAAAFYHPKIIRCVQSKISAEGQRWKYCSSNSFQCRAAMVKYLKGETNKWGSKEKAANKQNISLKSHSVSVWRFPTTDSEELAASSSPIIPQACCKEHRLGPHWQVTVIVYVAPQEDIRTDLWQGLMSCCIMQIDLGQGLQKKTPHSHTVLHWPFHLHFPMFTHCSHCQ